MDPNSLRYCIGERGTTIGKKNRRGKNRTQFTKKRVKIGIAESNKLPALEVITYNGTRKAGWISNSTKDGMSKAALPKEIRQLLNQERTKIGHLAGD